MAKRIRLTDIAVRKLKPVPGEQIIVYDLYEPRLMLRLNYGPRRPKVWTVRYYVNGKPRSKNLGCFPEMGVQAARTAARLFLESPKAALAKAKAGSFREIADEFLDKHVTAKGLRSAGEYRRHVAYALQEWASKPIGEIAKSDVTDLLDRIAAARTPVVADQVLATLRKLFNWHEARSDFRSPIGKGMRRTETVKRERVLTDPELKALWATQGQFADLCRVLVLTGQRLDKVASMRWADLSEEGVWTIPTEAREKGNGKALPLPQACLDILHRQPRIDGNPFVFTGTYSRSKDGKRVPAHISGYSKRKKLLDKNLKFKEPWRLHDLRRTARSLMGRCGVLPHIAERVIGHAQPAIVRIYDVHDYTKEKGEALAKVADLLTTIGSPAEPLPSAA